MFNDFALNFNAQQFDPRQSEGGICLPLADYPMEIINIAQVAVKDNANKGYIEISLKVLDGQYIGQIQKDRLNVYGQSEDTTRIGYQRLSAYAHIAGKLQLPNAGLLIGTKLIATCGPQNPPNEKYSEVKMVKDIAGNPPMFGQPCAAQPVSGQTFGHTASAAAPAAPVQGGWNNPAQPAAPAASAGFPVQTVPMSAPAGAAGFGAPAAPAPAFGAQPSAAAPGAPAWAR